MITILINYPYHNIISRNKALSPMNQLLLTLRFFATGDMYVAIGDFGGVSKSTAGRIIPKVTRALITLKNDHIFLPRTAQEINVAQQQFYEIARFPRVLAAVDGTHIRIQSPGIRIFQ